MRSAKFPWTDEVSRSGSSTSAGDTSRSGSSMSAGDASRSGSSTSAGDTSHGGSSTSLLVTNTALVIWAVLSLISLFLNGGIAVGIFFGFFLMALLTRLWGRLSIRNVRLTLRCSADRLFPGQTTILSYSVENDKLLPLPWLELTQNGPEARCLTPDSGFTAFHVPGTPAAALPALRQAFGRVGGHQTLTVEHIFTASRRGIWTIRDLQARTGDGFGLVQREAPLPCSRIPTIAVYPAVIDVDTSPFLRCQWDTRAGRTGFLEDQTILRGNREYQPGDSWKSINWRMAAREQGLPVNLYQTVSPFAVRFILDGESFARVPEMLEEALSILGSLLIALSSRRMDLSLSISRSGEMQALTLRAGSTGDVSELLLRLAGYHCLAEPDPDSHTEEGRIVLLPSAFPEDVIPEKGSSWLITRSGSRLPEELMNRMNPASAWVLCFEDPDVPERIGWHALDIRSLRKN